MAGYGNASWTLGVLGLMVACVEEPTPVVEPPSPTTPAPVSPPPTPWSPMIVETSPVTTTRELVAAGVTSVAPLGAADLVVVREDRVERLTAVGEAELWGFALPPVRAAAPWGTATLIATEDGLVTWDQGFVPTALDGLVEDVTALQALRSGLWLDSATGLKVWRDGVLQGVTVEGRATTGMARGRAEGAPVIWTADGASAVAVNFTDAGLTAYEAMAFFGPVDAVATDGLGDAFALVDGWLVARTARNTWTRLDFGSPVREVLGHAGADRVWARTDAAWLVWDGSSWRSTDVPTDVRGSLDALGRLVAVTDAGVERFGLGRPVLLVGLPEDDVLAAATVDVVVTLPELAPVVTVTATGLDGTPVDLPVTDGQFVLDPEVLADGLWSLTVTADYGDDQASTTATVNMGAAFAPTWPDHVRPIYESSCRPCHEPGQAVVALDTEAAWIALLDVGTSPDSAGILDRVRIDNMPSDERVVAPLDKALLEIWASGLPTP
jgi:hypothetical protein